MIIPAPNLATFLGTAFDADRTPKVFLRIGGNEYAKVDNYYYETDVLSLGDNFSATIPDPNGAMPGKIKRGDLIGLVVADPDVLGGKAVPKLLGRVTNRNAKTDRSTGTVITITGADLGWHLSNSDAKVWFKLRGATMQTLLTAMLDPSWKFQGVRSGLDLNRTVNLGRAGASQAIGSAQDGLKVIPPIQVEVGQKVGELLVDFARRERWLLNVSADGWLQFFRPNYKQAALYRFNLHQPHSGKEKLNNVESAELDEDIAGLFTRVDCYGQVLQQNLSTDSYNPNAGKFHRSYVPSPKPLPFERFMAFNEGDALKPDTVADRAKWKYERSLFEATTITIKVKNHQQGGVPFDIDTMAEFHCPVLGLDGTYYVQKVRYVRSRGEGVASYLTLRLPLLGA